MSHDAMPGVPFADVHFDLVPGRTALVVIAPIILLRWTAPTPVPPGASSPERVVENTAPNDGVPDVMRDIVTDSAPKTMIVTAQAPSKVEFVSTRHWEPSSPASPTRIITRTPDMRIVMLNDDALIEEMFALGEPTGLATLNGRTFLVPRHK